jgi:hypothetical protein
MIEWIKQQKQIFFQRNLSPMSQLHKSPEFIDLCRIDGVRGLSASHRAVQVQVSLHKMHALTLKTQALEYC